MLYEFCKEIRTLLAAQKYPVKVVFGPERVTRDKYNHGHVIVVEHDESGDLLFAPRGAQGNPPKVADRAIGTVATVYARSVLPNAHRGDHERECEKIVDAFTAAAAKWSSAARVPRIYPTRMGYAKPKPPPTGAAVTPEVWPGVAYEIHFTLPRGVYDRTYVGEQNAGAARPTGAATGVANRTDASAPGVDPATGCDST